MRLERLLLATDVQREAAALRHKWAKQAKAERQLDRYRQDVTDQGAHRCRGCGGWLFSVRPCSTPGCS